MRFKRFFDIIFSFLGLTIFLPLLVFLIIVIYFYDFGYPFYRPIRVGKDFHDFRMLKLRTMVMNADKIGSSSTSAKDPRITPIGHIIRKIKIDEIIQLWNVLKGDMSLVGPRPQVKSHIEKEYTSLERKLLSVKPGITDFSSIVFSDEGEILNDSLDVDKDYNQLIRPWKSRLGLFYIKHQSLSLDIKIILITIRAIFNKKSAIKSLVSVLEQLEAPSDLINVSLRDKRLIPTPLPQ